jgi:FkbM family methyltransferase
VKVTRPRFLPLLRSLHPSRAAELWRAVNRLHRPLALLRAYRGLGSTTFPLDVRTRDGLRFSVADRHDATTAWIVFARREYPVPAGGRCIVDLGANFGGFTLDAAARAPGTRIVAIEPHPHAYTKLTAHVRENALDDRVRCITVAVAARAGIRWMSMDPDDPGPSRGIYPASSSPDRSHVEVVATPLPDLLGRALAWTGAAEIDLLKMDVEGAEHELLDAFRDGALAPVRTLAMEYHPNGERAVLFAAIAAAGMRLHHHRDDGFGSGIAWFRR